ncbi:DNA-directed RNA polymerase I subunit RPA12 isoform X2 [Cheilinus undulatus]|uniref:DNA-directed RNA polymerase I subunit RPA12 isoform X2 n=1 Tax=Cheilinus undulatus TaxID=241271 RepID=UPI001BD5CEAB|nr:DNA-directed RNA polymerase I subunit RPA12 isoform X2 [Cheilinus undulatus]
MNTAWVIPNKTEYYVLAANCICMVGEMSCFSADPNFCPECGSVLPLPGVQDVVRCPRCSFSIPVAEFSGQEIRSTVVFNSVEQSTLSLDSEDSELKGPVIDRRCSRCNKEGMIYHTRQMRSADEGQTVFFTCIHCRYQEKEDS